ncbi:hypothetical protein, partial [Thauera sp.]|uniref:hypothetical protein n=1 Tax=Thauera sp. TaxID=1905334 RepID=UPI002CF9DBB2
MLVTSGSAHPYRASGLVPLGEAATRRGHSRAAARPSSRQVLARRIPIKLLVYILGNPQAKLLA